MLISLNLKNERILAADANTSEVHRCPECFAKVVLKKGKIKIPHFAHAVKLSCNYGEGESLEHMESKVGIYKSLQETYSADIEFNLGFARPDVYSDGVAYEFQKTAITPEEFARRTNLYFKHNTPVMWLLSDIDINRNKEQRVYRGRMCDVIRLKAFQRMLCYMNKMRIYTWSTEKDDVIQYTLDRVMGCRTLFFVVAVDFIHWSCLNNYRTYYKTLGNITIPNALVVHS